MEQSVLQELKARFPALPLLENEPMKRHTSFRIGGPAAAMALPRTVGETEELLAVLRRMEQRFFVMGNGTDLLFPDEGYDGVVLRTAGGLTKLSPLGETGIRAESGVLLSQAAVFARDRELTGLEFAHGIPGSIGGALIMNAGAYGGEMKDVAVRTVYLDETGERRLCRGEEHDFGYRHSRFAPGEVVLFTELRLAPGDGQSIREKMAELSEKRRQSQPLDLPSAGSAFKRPATGYAAALIDQAGLKGRRVGGAQVSEKHAGFIVNTGGATCRDVLQLMDEVRESVFRQSGVLLEAEIRTVR